MALWAIGDVQGCYTPLMRLLERIAFDPARDRLLFTGDLVNRGAESLRTLRFVRGLGAAAVSVLGNHDLHLLAAAHNGRLKPSDTLAEVLGASDRDELLAWLRSLPLAWADPARRLLLVHAGVPAAWTLEDTLARGAEVMQAFTVDDGAQLLAAMYGDQPDRWQDDLAGVERLRFIINALTRMRYASADGHIGLRHKGPPGTQPPGLMPWFDVPGRATADDTVIFGHWSTLGRVRWTAQRVIGLDSGCVWGARLTAICLDDQRVVDCGCDEYRRAGG